MIRAPDPARAQRAIIQDRLRRILGAALFAAIYAWVLFPVARFYWFVPAGWRFAALAVLPWRYWPWILGGEFYARVFCVVVPWHHGDSVTALFAYLSSAAGLSLVIAGPLGAIPGSVLLRRTMSAFVSSLNTPAGMSMLLAACLVSALGGRPAICCTCISIRPRTGWASSALFSASWPVTTSA